MTVDREQTKRAAEAWVGDGQIGWLAYAYLALLAELEQAERERDEVREDFGYALKMANDQAKGVLLLEARLAKVPALVEALRLIRDERCQCGGRFKWFGDLLRCEQCNRHHDHGHPRAIAIAALAAWESE